jgi:hypothetical protein
VYEKFEDTKGPIRSQQLKERQYNDQKKNDQKTNKYLVNAIQKINDRSL